MRRLKSMLLTTALAGFGSCLGPEHWSYSLTREACASGYWIATPESMCQQGYFRGECDPKVAAIFLGAVILLPPAIDTAILPITGIHDLFFLD